MAAGSYLLDNPFKWILKTYQKTCLMRRWGTCANAFKSWKTTAKKRMK